MDTGTPALTLGQTRLLATVIKTTRNMVGLADQQAWDAVADLEMLRREDLKRCFEMPLQEDKGELVAEALAVLLHLVKSWRVSCCARASRLGRRAGVQQRAGMRLVSTAK